MLNPVTHTYYWSGINTAQKRVNGEDIATSALLLKASLRQRGIQVIKIRRKKNSLPPFFNKKISSRIIIDFYQQLASSLHAGIPLITALELSADSYNNLSMRTLITSIKIHIENGETLSESLTKYPQYFDLLCCHLIYAEEQIGNLDTMLEKIIDYEKTMTLIKNKIKKALFYPSIILCASVIITLILLIYVIPELQNLFADFGKQLPAYTRWIMNISKQLRTYGWLLFVFFLFFYTLFYFLKIKINIKINIPILSNISEKYLTARWTHTLATTLNAGIPLTQSLHIVIKTMDNSHYQQAFQQIKEKITQGQAMHTAMEHTELFPRRVTQMIHIGEQSGALPIMLTQLSLAYQIEANDQIEIALNMLEPLLIIVLGVIIGGIVIAMYLPIFKLGSVI